MSSVLQSWLEDIPIRMQSTLLLGLRGPDTHACPHIKKITRWLRSLAFKPGNPNNCTEFMGDMPNRIKEKDACAKELEFCSQHYYSHLMHALQVVGNRYPDRDIGVRAFELYVDMCSLMHLPVESMKNFELRLRTIDWPAGVQPDTYDEALEQLKELPLTNKELS